MSETPEITLVKEFAAASDFEKKHTPFITAAPQMDKTLVSIEVGHEVPHPNEVGHYIVSIELFAGEVSIARFDLSPETTFPKVSIIVALSEGTALRAVEHCNLHGYWAYEVTI